MCFCCCGLLFFFFQAEDGIRDSSVTGVQTCALPILAHLDPVGYDQSLVGVCRRVSGVEEARQDRKSGVEGKSGDLGGRRIIKKKKKKKEKQNRDEGARRRSEINYSDSLYVQ